MVCCLEVRSGWYFNYLIFEWVSIDRMSIWWPYCSIWEENGACLHHRRNTIVCTHVWMIIWLFKLSFISFRGKFGEVMRCREKSTGRKLAAKFIAIHADSEKIAVKREIQIQSKLKHNRVLQLYDAFEKDRQMCIVMELWVVVFAAATTKLFWSMKC